MIHAEDAAKWFICRNPELSSGYMDENTKVNKLLYFSNLMNCCVNREKLIYEDFIAFPNGPVVFSIYRDYRYHGLHELPGKSPEIGGEQEKILNIVDFVYGGMTAEQLVEESHAHSLWKNVSHLIPNNPRIDFGRIEPELAEYNRALYKTYEHFDFAVLVKEKIRGNIYYYDKTAFKMTEDIIERLSRLGRYDEPKFLEMIGGELVIS